MQIGDEFGNDKKAGQGHGQKGMTSLDSVH
jgi:hypothetical protein